MVYQKCGVATIGKLGHAGSRYCRKSDPSRVLRRPSQTRSPVEGLDGSEGRRWMHGRCVGRRGPTTIRSRAPKMPLVLCCASIAMYRASSRGVALPRACAWHGIHPGDCRRWSTAGGLCVMRPPGAKDDNLPLQLTRLRVKSARVVKSVARITARSSPYPHFHRSWPFLAFSADLRTCLAE